MIEKAYAKINLSINVLGKRADGYHLLDMIMLPIDLYDVVEMELADEMEYHCNIDLPYNSRNIIYKTIELMRSEFEFKQNFKITLTKNIPMEAGLAGGSTDAAAILRMMNQLLNLNLSLGQLAMYGKRVGADVPYCIYSRCARVQGIGEYVTPFTLKEGYDLLLVKPKQGISTKLCFEMTDKDNDIHPDMDELQKAFALHQPMAHLMGNSLQPAAIHLLPQISDIIEECKNAGYENSLMTGSGSTCFVIAPIGTNFDDLSSKLSKKYDFVYKTRVLTM